MDVRQREKPTFSVPVLRGITHTLEAALWCLLNTNDYSSCVLRAVNLGGDTDTVAAVSGGLAGVGYG